MNIITLIESYGIEVKKQGKLYVAFCPFHDDKNTPNLIIYPNTNSWYCFACSHGGDAIQFIALIEHKDRKEVENTYIEDNIDRNLQGSDKRENNNLNFKDEVLFLTSTVCRSFLQTHKDKTDNMLFILKKLDEKLDKVAAIDYKNGRDIVDKFKKFVYNIGEVTDENH